MNHLPPRRTAPRYPAEQTELSIAANKRSWRAKYLDAAIAGIGQQLLRTEQNSHGERLIAEELMDELFSLRLTAREEEREFRSKWREIQGDRPPEAIT